MEELIEKHLNGIDDKIKKELLLFLTNTPLSDDKEKVKELLIILERMKISAMLYTT